MPARPDREDASPVASRLATPTDRSSGTRLSELIAALSFSTDLALGQPMEHVLRSCLIELRLADLLGLDDEQRAETYWVTLLATVCTAESFEFAQLFGDDIAFRAGMFHVGPSQLSQMVYVLGLAASKPGGRVRTVSGILSSGGKNIEASFIAHCAVTREIADRIGLPPTVGQALTNTFARWDGKGVPRGVSSEGVQVPVRLMQLADMAEVHVRTHGVEGAIHMVDERAGKFRLLDIEAPDRAATVGDGFSSKGANNNGTFHDRSTVVQADPGERFGFDTDSTLDRKHGKPFHARFEHRYAIEPSAGGAVVRYTCQGWPQNYVPYWLRRGMRGMTRRIVEPMMRKNMERLAAMADSGAHQQVGG